MKYYSNVKTMVRQRSSDSQVNIYSRSSSLFGLVWVKIPIDFMANWGDLPSLLLYSWYNISCTAKGQFERKKYSNFEVCNEWWGKGSLSTWRGSWWGLQYQYQYISLTGTKMWHAEKVKGSCYHHNFALCRIVK